MGFCGVSMASKIFTKTLMIFSTLDNGGIYTSPFFKILILGRAPDGNPPQHKS